MSASSEMRFTCMALAFALATHPSLGWAAPADAGEDTEVAPAGEDEPGVPEPEAEPEPDAADEDAARTEAIEAFRSATRSYELGRYEAAIAGFERAWELTEAPQLLYNLGQAHRKHFDVEPDVEHLRRAKVFFENYDKRMRDAEFYDAAEVKRVVEEIDRQIEAQEALDAERKRPVIVGPSLAEQEAALRRRLELERQFRVTRGLDVSGITFIVLGSAALAMGLVGLTTRLATGSVLDSSSGGSGGVNLASVEQDSRRRRQYLLGGQIAFAGFLAGGVMLPVGITLRVAGRTRARKGIGGDRPEQGRAVSAGPGRGLITVHF